MANNQARLENIFNALADQTRLAIIQNLGKGAATVSDLAEPFEMALPSFMKHIRVLEESGLITSRKVGRVRICEVQPASFAKAGNWLEQQRTLWEERTDRLAMYAENLMIEE